MPAKKEVTEKQVKTIWEKIGKKFTPAKNKKIEVPAVQQERTSLWGKIGFTLGLVAVGSWLIPILGLLVTVTGMVFSLLGLRAEKGRWFAIAGLTLAIVFLNLTFVYGFYNILLSIFRSSSGI